MATTDYYFVIMQKVTTARRNICQKLSSKVILRFCTYKEYAAYRTLCTSIFINVYLISKLYRQVYRLPSIVAYWKIHPSSGD